MESEIAGGSEPDAERASGIVTPRGLVALWLSGLALVVILATACGSGDADAGTRPLGDILAGLVQVTDLTSSGAVVRVETTVDVVYSVVYGTDTSYGSQSTDLDMAGRAHSSHAALFRDLEPDTVYHYRLQGSASDGTLYVSEDMTFRTPPAEEASSEPGPNLAAPAAGAQIRRPGRSSAARQPGHPKTR